MNLAYLKKATTLRPYLKTSSLPYRRHHPQASPKTSDQSVLYLHLGASSLCTIFTQASPRTILKVLTRTMLKTATLVITKWISGGSDITKK